MQLGKWFRYRHLLIGLAGSGRHLLRPNRGRRLLRPNRGRRLLRPNRGRRLLGPAWGASVVSWQPTLHAPLSLGDAFYCPLLPIIVEDLSIHHTDALSPFADCTFLVLASIIWLSIFIASMTCKCILDCCLIKFFFSVIYNLFIF